MVEPGAFKPTERSAVAVMSVDATVLYGNKMCVNEIHSTETECPGIL